MQIVLLDIVFSLDSVLTAVGMVDIDKAFTYAAMAFSVFVETLNLRARRKRPIPVELRPTFVKQEAEADADAGGAY